MKVSIMFPSRFVCAADLQGKSMTKTIKGVEAEDLRMEDNTKEKKYILYFSDAKKGLVLNKTNAQAIAAMYGGETDGWVGKKVTLYPTTCQCFGETVDCIRIKAGKPNAAAVAYAERRAAAAEASQAEAAADSEPAHDPQTGEVTNGTTDAALAYAEPDAGSNG